MSYRVGFQSCLLVSVRLYVCLRCSNAFRFRFYWVLPIACKSSLVSLAACHLSFVLACLLSVAYSSIHLSACLFQSLAYLSCFRSSVSFSVTLRISTCLRVSSYYLLVCRVFAGLFSCLSWFRLSPWLSIVSSPVYLAAWLAVCLATKHKTFILSRSIAFPSEIVRNNGCFVTLEAVKPTTLFFSSD